MLHWIAVAGDGVRVLYYHAKLEPGCVAHKVAMIWPCCWGMHGALPGVNLLTGGGQTKD